ncbi:MAG: hypothetical protein ACXABY_22385 [Candidatus Thorarchaeota archaeon]|jgi:hypothetical protein
MINNLPPEVREHLLDWKKQYGEVFFLPSIGGRGLLLKNFTLGEHEDYLLECELDEEQASENLVNKCVVWPTDFDLDNLPAAAVGVILNKLTEVCPYDNPTRFFGKLDQKRSVVNTPKGQIYAFIVAGFGMSLQEIRALNFEEVIMHVALAEKILGQSFQLTEQGELQAVPEQGMSPAQLQQMQRHQKLKEKRAAREAALHGRRLSEVGEQPPLPETGHNTLIQDRDELMNALRHGE